MIDLKAEMKKRPIYGPFQRIPSPDVVEILGRSGWDFLLIDGEHGPMIGTTLLNQIRAAESANIPPIVRVDGPQSPFITKAIDAGARGITVPLIETVDDVHKAVSFIRHHPLGSRGACPFVRAAGFGDVPWAEFKRRVDNDLLLVLLCERAAAVENIREIASVKGIDVIMVGRFDLSLSLGLGGQMDHPQIWKKAEEVSNICFKEGLFAGQYIYNAQEARRAIDMGFRFLVHLNDANLFYKASRKAREELPGA